VKHCQIIRVAVAHAAGRVPIMAGCGRQLDPRGDRVTKFSKEVGADCTLQVVPYYNKPSQEGIYQHFKAIAEKRGPGRWCCTKTKRYWGPGGPRGKTPWGGPS